MTEIDCGVSSIGVLVFVPVLLRPATNPWMLLPVWPGTLEDAVGGCVEGAGDWAAARAEGPRVSRIFLRGRELCTTIGGKVCAEEGGTLAFSCAKTSCAKTSCAKTSRPGTKAADTLNAIAKCVGVER
jgi:hypothetical protein